MTRSTQLRSVPHHDTPKTWRDGLSPQELDDLDVSFGMPVLCRVLKCGETKASRLCHSGELARLTGIEPLRLGKSWLFRTSDLRRFLAGDWTPTT